MTEIVRSAYGDISLALSQVIKELRDSGIEMSWEIQSDCLRASWWAIEVFLSAGDWEASGTWKIPRRLPKECVLPQLQAKAYAATKGLKEAKRARNAWLN